MMCNCNDNYCDKNMMGCDNKMMDCDTDWGRGMSEGYGCGCNETTYACPCKPVCEPPIERCVHRTIVQEVPHICPINTTIVNHHVCRHTYRPEYSCKEVNECCNMNQGSCCDFC